MLGAGTCETGQREGVRKEGGRERKEGRDKEFSNTSQEAAIEEINKHPVTQKVMSETRAD